ncbi:glycosyltransferase family 4 protein [Cellulomonas fengjieae]|uniref:glycosyltransferase family 4 protein n=1 Tax=Cellulomonas fengjieae TaxID=2819978 RepID=UPI0027DD9AEE|nr:glycosyltransferase family 4 protein [Cellulomonas fengjieae]
MSAAAGDAVSAAAGDAMSAADAQGRLRVLVSAYACGPLEEPEAGAGWAFAVAAARHHDVWVVTRPRFRTAVEAALADDPELAARLRVRYLDLPDRIRALKRRSWDVYWYYAAWQRAFARLGRTLHDELRFDVVHHVTFANDWLPCGAAQIAGPALVWGPVGGASRLPVRRLAPWLGVRGTATELVRVVASGVPRRIWGDRAARRAALVVAQNPDVAERFGPHAPVTVHPNAAFGRLPAPVRDEPHTGPVAVFAARLLAWKGGRLAIDALARPEISTWRLDVYGTGYELAALRRRAARRGVTDRVRFLGHRPRDEVLAAFAGADAMLFPSMHDQAGWVAAEASALGCPVVCLPLGGPPVLAGRNARVVDLDGDLVGNLARELVRALAEPGTPHDSWSADRLPALVDGWYAQAVRPGTGRQGS